MRAFLCQCPQSGNLSEARLYVADTLFSTRVIVSRTLWESFQSRTLKGSLKAAMVDAVACRAQGPGHILSKALAQGTNQDVGPT